MKTVKWIHLSDLHLNKPGVENRRIREQLLNYLISQNIHCDYIFFTGDLRYAPAGEFSPSTIEFLEKICECLDVSKDNFFIVPGNHDIDLYDSVCLEGKSNILDNYDFHQGIIQQEDLEHVYAGKHDYINFLEQFYDENNLALKLSKNALQPHFIIETEDFNILHVDTTLSCTLERSRDLYIGTDLLMNACETINQNKPTILLTHYSFDSMHTNEQVEILKLLHEYNIQLWFAGHEHRELARMQRDFFYEFQCGNLVYEDDQTRACVYLGKYSPDTYLGSVQLHFWLSPDSWTIYPFLKNRSSIYEFKLQDNTSQVIKIQNVINSQQNIKENKYINTYDKVDSKQGSEYDLSNKGSNHIKESEQNGIFYNEDAWEGFLYLDENCSPLLELKIYYSSNETCNVFKILSDSLDLEIKTETNNEEENIILEMSVNYDLSFYSDVSIRLKHFEDIRQYLSADTVRIRMIDHDEHNIIYKVKCIGDEKWNELIAITNYWYECMKIIAKIEQYYNVRFDLPRKMSEEEKNAMSIIADSLDYKSCRHLPGIPDKYPGLKKDMILERDTWLNDGADLSQLTLFGYTFKPVAQFLMKGNFVWNNKKEIWESDQEEGIPIRVEFEIDNKNIEPSMMRRYSLSEMAEAIGGFLIVVLPESDATYLQYYAKLIYSFKKLQQLYTVYKEQLSNFIVFDVENNNQYKFIIEKSKKVITRVAANELLNSVVNAGGKLVKEINNIAVIANFQLSQWYENFADEWTYNNGGFQFLTSMKIYANNGYFPLSLSNEGVGYFDFHEIYCTVQNNCNSNLKEIMNLTNDLLIDCGLSTDIIDAYPMIRNYIYTVYTVYLKYMLAMQPEINTAFNHINKILMSHKDLFVKTGIFEGNIVYLHGGDNNIYSLEKDDNLMANFYKHKETVINDLRESRQGVKNDSVEWNTVIDLVN